MCSAFTAIPLPDVPIFDNAQEYCVRLEQLTRAAYPESSEREFSILRTGEVIAQLTEWMERSREVALHLKQEATNKPKRCQRGRQTTQRHEHVDQTKVKKERQEHVGLENPNQNMQQNGRDCKGIPRPQHTAGRPKVPQGGKGKSVAGARGARSFSTVLRHWACTRVAKKNANDLVGSQTLETEKGFGVDGNVEEIPQRKYLPVYDASGTLMNFRGIIRLTLELRNGPRCRAAFFVMKGDGMIVLGTNILHALGYSISRKGQPGRDEGKRPNHQGIGRRRNKRARKPDRTREPRQAKVAAFLKHTQRNQGFGANIVTDHAQVLQVL
ncbi:unnamed protein product [Cylicostephanus goldi]|uniref:Uncharacterized protein n=1 Tax=Cylicostephanus goldi TaxID=71465 RepID=A0A3P7MXS9_CYLGO|nr:unnamed protein product [Cylicostephanus goldi]